MLFSLTNRLGSKGLLPIITAIKTFILYAIICFPFVDIAIAESINTSNYFPLESGKQWTYLENGLNTVTITVLSGYEYVNGVQTKIVQLTGGESSGLKLNYTNDSNGIRRHKEFDPDVFVEGVGFVDVTVIYDPPMRSAYQTANIGELIYSSGNLEVTFSGIGTFDLHYDQTTKIVGFENINVPLRNFKAIKIQQSLTMSGYIGDEYVSETMTSTDWLAEYIGIAKERNVSGSDTETIELTDINFAPPISANFSAAPIDGLTPLSVSFNDESIGYINNWSWDFGDGSTSTNQHPSHTYINPDTYTISLTVTGLGGSDTETKTDYVIVKEHVSMPWIPLLLLDD